MLKSKSQVWKAAVKLSKRKYCNSKPVALSECGQYVTMQSLIRGNTWQYSLNELLTLLNRK